MYLMYLMTEVTFQENVSPKRPSAPCFLHLPLYTFTIVSIDPGRFFMLPKNRLFYKVLLMTGMITLATMNTDPAEAYQYVKLQGRQLVADFDMDGFYETFFVKGVGYAPIPIGKFMGSGDGWSAVCQYAGPFPLQYPELRFEPGSASPDGAYTCGPNGEKFYDNITILNRDFPLIKDMKANSIRTWGNVTPSFMQKANEYGLKVIAGYWVDHNIDYTFISPTGAQQRQALIDGFVSYVNTFKNEPALLMWGLSNENNLNFCNPCVHGQTCDRAAQAVGYYQLMNDMALAAKQAEGTSFHPIVVVSAELTADVINFASYMPAADIIGINSYRGSSFAGFPAGKPNLFDEFEANFPDKSMIITEFGVDAWNSGSDPDHPENGSEDQISQAIYISSAWDEIVQNAVSNGGPVNGGVVFHYSDAWNGYSQRPAGADPSDSCIWVSSDWTPSVITQDHNYTDPAVFGIGSMPDNKVNPEWWGMMSVEQNFNGSVCATPAGIDCMHPRDAYYALKEKFNQPPVLGPIGNKTVNEGVSLTFTITATDPNGDSLIYSAAGLPGGAALSVQTFTWIPDFTQAGTYSATFHVSDGSLTASETITITVLDVPRADLVMTAVSGPASGVTGTTISIANTVNNQGTAPAGTFYVGLYLSSDAVITTADTRVGRRSYSSLAAGAANSVSTSVTLPTTLAAGTYYIGAIADYTGTITENSETNNAFAGNTVTVTAGPDLVMATVSGPASAARGTSITISNSILNQGVGTATNTSYVGFYLSKDPVITTGDQRIGRRSISSLAIGAANTATTAVTVPSTFAVGTYYIGVIADYSNTVKESNETNNALAGNTLVVQ